MHRYAEMAALFNKRVDALGKPFAERLRALRSANLAHQRRVDMLTKQDSDRANDGISNDGRVYARARSAPTEMHTKVPISKLVCPVGDSPVAIETCQRVYADTPFRYNWRATFSVCCQRIKHCLTYRMAKRRVPNHCYKWLPLSADPYNRNGVRRDPGYSKMLFELNRTMSTICQDECTAPPDPEPMLLT
jgi:hypothetical protein